MLYSFSMAVEASSALMLANWSSLAGCWAYWPVCWLKFPGLGSGDWSEGGILEICLFTIFI